MPRKLDIQQCQINRSGRDSWRTGYSSQQHLKGVVCRGLHRPQTSQSIHLVLKVRQLQDHKTIGAIGNGRMSCEIVQLESECSQRQVRNQKNGGFKTRSWEIRRSSRMSHRIGELVSTGEGI